MHQRHRIFVLLTLMLLSGSPAIAQQSDVYVPPDLEPWRDWVLQGEEYRQCPFYANRGAGNGHLCAWPGTLNLVINQRSAQFIQSWNLLTDGWIELPGDAQSWPLDVRTGSEALAVVHRNGMPMAWLEAGQYRVTGQFSWGTRPGSLKVPWSIGLLDLTLDGERISVPDRRRDMLWLGERQRTVEQQERVSVEVYRLLTDNIPQNDRGIIRLNVSGPSREVALGKALLPGFVPMRLDSALPVRLEADGLLRAQVRPGNWEITLISRAANPANSFQMAAPVDTWPKQEIWSYNPVDRLRITAAESANPVDPSQVGVPGEWQNLAAFRMEPGTPLDIIERQRGLSDQDSNRLSLSRQMWLDFDASDYTIRDQISGMMRRDWRLDMAAPYALTSAKDLNTNQNYLVTDGADGQTGIEVRDRALNVQTLARIIDPGASLGVSGWVEQFDDVDMDLSLPPGYRLLAAPGADRSPDTWIDQWSLLNLFLVLLIAVAAGRLVNPLFGVVTLIMITLTYHEVFAPVWAWLNLLVAIALAGVAPEGRFRALTKRYRQVSFLAVLLIAIPFVADQVRLALYPQLERSRLIAKTYDDALSGYGRYAGFSPAVDAATVIPADQRRLREQSEANMARINRAADTVAEEVDTLEQPSQSSGGAGVSNAVKTLRPQFEPKQIERYAENTLLQTGPGKPQWSWNNYRLSWSGPVTSEESFSLVIAPRWLISFWRVLGVLLLGFVFYRLFKLGDRFRKADDDPDSSKGAAATAGSVAAVLIAALAVFSSPAANADIPDASLLQELRQRLTENPECDTQCAEFASASVSVTENQVDMTLTINAVIGVAVPLPGMGGRWEPATVRVDGQPRRDIVRTPDGVMWIELGAGEHEVRVAGPLGDTDSHELTFTMRPHSVQMTSTGWDTSGVVNERLLAGSIGLTRIKQDGEQQTLSSDRFPTFVKVTRNIALNLDWTMTTTVHRQAPASGAITVEVPLLEGETVESDRVEVKGGKVIAAIGANQNVFSWNSQLERSSGLVLAAGTDQPWSETWQLTASPTWHVAFSGVPEVDTSNLSMHWIAEFDPLPGETLNVYVDRPDAIAGSTLAIDSVFLTTHVGKRASDSTLSFSYRSTQGAQHPITLPEGAEVTRVSVDGRSIPLRPEGNVLPLGIEPGQHQVEVDWRGADGAGTRNQTAVVNLNSPASNLRLQLQLPENRWVLFTGGPTLGPVVLYWAELIAMIGFALLLGRIKRTPLKTHDWILLGLGLSTFSWGMLLLFAAWLFVMDYQKEIRARLEGQQFNLMQLALGMFTIIVLVNLLVAVPNGLLGSPDMQIIDSDRQANTLNWFDDQTEGEMPAGSAITAPLWLYKVAILLWSLWLSFSLIRWLPWAWRQFTEGGLWQGQISLSKKEKTDKVDLQV